MRPLSCLMLPVHQLCQLHQLLPRLLLAGQHLILPVVSLQLLLVLAGQRPEHPVFRVSDWILSGWDLPALHRLLPQLQERRQMPGLRHRVRLQPSRKSVREVLRELCDLPAQPQQHPGLRNMRIRLLPKHPRGVLSL